MQKGGFEKLILRTLLRRELSGYDVYKEMSMKGVKIRPNYLYMILGSMQRKGVLNGRWISEATGPRKHLFSVSKKGENEFRNMVKESVGLLMDAFINANSTAKDLPDHSNAIKAMFDHLDIPYPSHGAKLVVATPSFDPLLCLPIAFNAIGEAFPSASIFIIKPPTVKLLSNKPNLTFLDGWRHDMPLKDGFADYLFLEGFPNDVSEEEALSECLRVLNDHGQLIIRHSRVMSEEKKPKFSTFGEFADRLFYDFSEQDRTINVEHVEKLVSMQCRKTGHGERGGNLVIFGSGKKQPQQTANLPREERIQSLRRDSLMVRQGAG